MPVIHSPTLVFKVKLTKQSSVLGKDLTKFIAVVAEKKIKKVAE